MSMLFDQETVTKIREYNIAKQARGEGREDGMKATISILQDMSLDKEQIIQKLVEAYQILPAQARKYTEKYLKQ